MALLFGFPPYLGYLAIIMAYQLTWHISTTPTISFNYKPNSNILCIPMAIFQISATYIHYLTIVFTTIYSMNAIGIPTIHQKMNFLVQEDIQLFHLYIEILKILSIILKKKEKISMLDVREVLIVYQNVNSVISVYDTLFNYVFFQRRF